ncbi:asparagine synthase [Halobiforma nitratireducens JCM 10879]|uniref:Asparagine synthase n=2 Tax=Halobiforma nitratireducens TaxID=130048 RepID=M0MP33_9EURY|nr:asparagine synthase [Halobiforma nitratireducens JCM 10879]
MSSALRSTFEDRVCDVVGIDQYRTREDVADAFEFWDWQERQAKHILRTYLYDYWDYDFWYPLWDREFMDFWTTVPLEHRFERSLFERYVRSVYADAAGLSMDEVQETFHERSPWVSRIEKALSGTPLKDPVEQLYRHHISPREYDDNPIWGIMDRDQFDRLQSGRQVIHAFRVLELLGRMSFSPPTDGYISRDREVTTETVGRSRPPSALMPTDEDTEQA